jgi:hypothetical protein
MSNPESRFFIRFETKKSHGYRQSMRGAWSCEDCYSSPQLYTFDPAWSAWSYLGLNFKSLVSSIFAKTIGRQAFVAKRFQFAAEGPPLSLPSITRKRGQI